MFKQFSFKSYLKHYLINYLVKKKIIKSYSENISRKIINSNNFQQIDNKFFQNVQNTYLEIDNFTSKENSIAGWVPYFKNKTKIYLFNFLSVNYSIRKPVIARLTLVKDQKNFIQKSIVVPINYSGEIDLDEFFKSDDNFNSLIVEIFSPLIKKNHGSSDGHFRFYGKYYSSLNNLNCMVHSMPITKISSIVSKISNHARTYLIEDYKQNKFYNCYPCGKNILQNIDSTNYGFTVIQSPSNEILSIHHQSILPRNKLEKKFSASYVPNEDGKSLDPYIYIDRIENENSLGILKFYIVKDNKIIEKKQINSDGKPFLMRESEIFGKKIKGKHFICLEIESYGNGYFHIHYVGSNGELSDQVHSGLINWSVDHNQLIPKEKKTRSNCRKFCTFEIKKNSENTAIIYIDQVSNNEKQEIVIRFFINNQEYVRSLKVTSDQPFLILNINKIVFDITSLSVCEGILQIESYFNNYPAIYLHKNSLGNICTDHFTGG